jgi:hypothetical protein
VSLKIRQEQIEAFQPAADAGFVRRLAEYLRSAHSESVVRIPSGSLAVSRIPSLALSRMVQNGIARGRRYDLTSESSLAAFVAIMFVAAPNFDSHPLIQIVLQDPDVAPDRRIENLWRRISLQNWRAVEAYYDASAWGLEDQPGT